MSDPVRFEVTPERRAKMTPKIILEGTRLTHKTDLAFALNEHPRIVGPRRYRYHSPLISAEWCGFSPFPWGRGPIDFDPDQEALAMETYAHLGAALRAPALLQLDRRPVPPLDPRLPAGRAGEGRRLRAGSRSGSCRSASTSRCSSGARRRSRRPGRSASTVSGKPSQYDDLGAFIAEQDLLRSLAAGSRLPVREFDVSDDDLAGTCERIADWLESTGGLWAPP